MTTENDETLKQSVLNLVFQSDRKLSPAEIENILSAKSGLSKKCVRQALRGLIFAGELAYSYLFGASYIEKSFNRPVQISASVVVKPCNISYIPEPGEIVIDMIPGISFGAGDHPTTRLSIRGIEYALRERQLIPDFLDSTVLDIGTGSGILAIAALKFGIETGVGTDTDPCAISEAKQNAYINGVDDRLRIINASEPIAGPFSLITANLRFPDIMNLFPVISALAELEAPVVISGIRPEEIPSVLVIYTKKHFNCLKTSEEKNWSAIVLQKNP